MDKNLLYSLRGITAEEVAFVSHITSGMNEQQSQLFITFYSQKRQKPDEILLFTLIGLFFFAGVQRFIMGQIGMGFLYFFTCGLCFVGTILDAINHRALANEHNQKVAMECAELMQRGY